MDRKSFTVYYSVNHEDGAPRVKGARAMNVKATDVEDAIRAFRITFPAANQPFVVIDGIRQSN